MIKYKVFISCLLLATLVGLGCATSLKTEKLRSISLGMPKGEVVKNLGEPTAVRGSIKNKFNQNVEVWEYELVAPKHTSAGEEFGNFALAVISIGTLANQVYKDNVKTYWLYFYDNKLAQWGEAGDWSKEADRIYQFDFNPSPKISR